MQLIKSLGQNYSNLFDTDDKIHLVLIDFSRLLENPGYKYLEAKTWKHVQSAPAKVES